MGESLVDLILKNGDTDRRAAQEYCDLKRHIAELESQLNNNKWISVEEELPRDAKPVIVRGGCGHYSHKYKKWFTNMERDRFGEYLPIQWEVTHWMPIPVLPNT